MGRRPSKVGRGTPIAVPLGLYWVYIRAILEKWKNGNYCVGFRVSFLKVLGEHLDFESLHSSGAFAVFLESSLAVLGRIVELLIECSWWSRTHFGMYGCILQRVCGVSRDALGTGNHARLSRDFGST